MPWLPARVCALPVRSLRQRTSGPTRKSQLPVTPSWVWPLDQERKGDHNPQGQHRKTCSPLTWLGH